MNRQFKLEKAFEIRPEVYNYSNSAYSQASFLFLRRFRSNRVKGPSRHPESPALFLDSVQDLNANLESKTTLWYLDDRNLSDDYRTVLNDLKKFVRAEKRWDSTLNPGNANFFSW